MTRTNQELERAMTNALLRLQLAPTPTLRAAAWAELQRLHQERAADPVKVRALEQARGLAQ